MLTEQNCPNKSANMERTGFRYMLSAIGSRYIDKSKKQMYNIKGTDNRH